MSEQLPPTDQEKQEQSAAGLVAIMVLVGAGFLVATAWRGGLARTKDLIVWAGDKGVLTPLSWLHNPEFWFDSWWGYGLFILLTVVTMRVCGLLTIYVGKGLNGYFHKLVEGHLRESMPAATTSQQQQAQEARVQRFAGIGAFVATTFCLAVAALLVSIPLVWLYFQFDPLHDYRVAVLAGGKVHAKYYVVPACIAIGLLIGFPRRD